MRWIFENKLESVLTNLDLKILRRLFLFLAGNKTITGIRQTEGFLKTGTGEPTDVRGGSCRERITS